MQSIDIVVPCFNEEEVIETFLAKTTEIIDSLKNYSFHFIFVDDGSRDGTFDILKNLSLKYNNVNYISLSRNFGKEAAIFAGLKHSVSDYVIIMDVDLQHPPSLIPPMITGIEEGYDSCAAKRSSRKGESIFRSFFSNTFYHINNKITNVKLEKGTVDYRIMSRKMVDAVLSLCEVQRFSKGLFSWVGFKTKWIPYENIERTLGRTKWSFNKLFKYAMDGITSFSIAPLRLVTFTGFIISIVAFIYIIITLIQTLIYGIDVPGYVTTLLAVLFLGGITELSIGILGEYVGHIYMETKKRPIYIIKQTSIEQKGNCNDEKTN